MYLLPAIDMLDGRAVRLAKGDYDAVTVYSDNPVQQAVEFARAGARWLHVVDLDGARSGIPLNLDVIKGVIDATDLNVEVGGGVRSMDTLESLIDAGAKRVVIGTKLITDPDFAKEAVSRFGDAICAGVDAKGGEVAIQGWREGAGIPADELVCELAGWGIRHLVYTDISRDGMQTGIDISTYEHIATIAGFPVIASGGIASLEDIRALAATNAIEGAIMGRALYERAFSLTDAIAVLAEASGEQDAPGDALC